MAMQMVLTWSLLVENEHDPLQHGQDLAMHPTKIYRTEYEVADAWQV